MSYTKINIIFSARCFFLHRSQLQQTTNRNKTGFYAPKYTFKIFYYTLFVYTLHTMLATREGKKKYQNNNIQIAFKGNDHVHNCATIAIVLKLNEKNRYQVQRFTLFFSSCSRTEIYRHCYYYLYLYLCSKNLFFFLLMVFMRVSIFS